MRWTFKAEELSMGHYRCLATREDGQSVSRDGGEAVIGETIRDAYLAEVALGTHEVEALYEVTRSYKKRWSAEYHEFIMGTWDVSDPASRKSISYDGRDMYLMVMCSASRCTWQGGISELAKPDCGYFHELIRL